MIKNWTKTINKASYTFREAIKLAYKVNPKWFLITVLANSVWGLFDIPLLLISKALIDTVIEAIKEPNWRNYVDDLAIYILLQAAFDYGRQFTSRFAMTYNQVFTRRVDANVTIAINRKHGNLDIPTIEDPEFQDKYDKVSTESSRRVWGLVRPLFDMFQGIVGLISNLIIVATFTPLVIPFFLLLSLPEAFVNTRFTKKDYELRTNESNKYRFWAWFNQYLKGGNSNYETRIFNLHSHFYQKLTNMVSTLFKRRESLQFERTYWITAATIFRTLFFAGFNIYLFVLALAQTVTLGYAQMVFRAGTAFQNYLAQITRSITEIYENQLYIKDLVWLLNLEPKTKAGNQKANIELSQGIEFQKVWFKYPHSKEWILKDVSFKIDPQENIALVGENGAGKTTLIKLLSDFYQPQKGKILVNGIDIKQYSKASYRKLLSVLFQEFEQYPFSAAESIGYGDLSRISNLEDIKSAAQMTNIDEWISKLPKGYKHPISKQINHGIEPSKGQWQRIALARALFKQSPIIILDEPTSNVDAKSEEEIFNHLINLNKERIIILISHRFSTVRKADRILVLDNGKIVESGSHEQLMKKNKIYANLFTIQAKSYQ